MLREALTRGPNPGRLDRAEPLARPTSIDTHLGGDTMRRVGFVALATIVLLGSAAIVYAGNGVVPGWHSNSDKYTAMAVTNPNDPTDVSDTLVRERTPDAVLDQHITALNRCDWHGLMQQYPDSYELRLPGGTVVTGRTEAAATFAGFVKPHAEGGLCGITFSEISRQVTGGTLAVTWEANASFLAEPYQGSDAYITDDGLMVSMVSTFDGAELQFKP
jgi:hypothetical protein